MGSSHRNTVAMIMKDGRPRIYRDVDVALKSRGIKLDPSEISQALKELAMMGELQKDGRGKWDHATIYQKKINQRKEDDLRD